MRTFLIGALLLGAGCFGDREPVSADTQRQLTPAEQARDELRTMLSDVRALPATQHVALAAAGPRLATSDPTTRAAVGIADELREAFASEPALVVDGSLAATAPSLAARVKNIREALGLHAALLQALHVTPLPPVSDVDTGGPDDAFVEAAVLVEETSGGRWPLKRIFIAYALELEAIRDEAQALVSCGEACPAGVAERAAALEAAAGRLAARLEEFAALYC